MTHKRNVNDVAWNKKYEELKQFKCREGHCNVPQRFSENQSLGKWVKVQRTQYKNMTEGKSSHITELRIQLLEDIGFSWRVNDPRDIAWLKMYEELKQFKIRTGHYNVP